MTLKTVRLELARDPDFPNGSSRHGYELSIPLGDDGHIDAAAWRKLRKDCGVRRFWAGEADQSGHLRHTQGGTWTFHYDVAGNADDDDRGYHFETHVFKEGEYVSLREQDGRLRTFRVVSVRP